MPNSHELNTNDLKRVSGGAGEETFVGILDIYNAANAFVLSAQTLILHSYSEAEAALQEGIGYQKLIFAGRHYHAVTYVRHYFANGDYEDSERVPVQLED